MTSILLIDDNRNFQLGLAANLRREGFEVMTASNGEDGIKLASEALPALILCDLKMPVPDGMAVKRQLEAEPVTADIPFIFLTALDSLDNKINGLSAGAEDYITKPVDLNELVARIHAVLRRKEKADLKAKQEVLELLENLKNTLPLHTSHLFRTYVGILLLSLEMIKKQVPNQEQSLRIAYESTFRIKKLINDLIWLNELDLGRLSTYAEQVNLDLSFKLPVCELVETWKSKDLQMEMTVEPGVLVIAPLQHFTQSILHLVDNACKFSPTGGLIKIHLASNGLGGCVLTVEDQGPGIPIPLREVVFKRFYQVPNEDNLPQNHGLGLGLYLAKSFAESQGGDVQIMDSLAGCKVQMRLGKNSFS